MTDKSYNLLLVEDDKNLGYILKEYLELNSFKVHWAKNGNQGLNYFKTNIDYDACIFDVMMPEKDGFSLAEDIKEIDNQIPIIFLTAKSLKIDKLKAYKIGCDDYIVKPVDEELLIARIHAILKRTAISEDPIEQNPTFSIGEFEFDTINQRLLIRDQTFKLTSKETKLLKLLCTHKNNLLTRKEALNKIWNENDYFTRRSMDVYITRLRKYLAMDSRIKIENVHGKGFILSDHD